jgi:hypothetical protein
VNTTVFELDQTAFREDPFSADEVANLERHLRLAEELRSCRYFTEEERTLNVTMDRGVTTSWEQTLPDRGSTREMLAVMRQLFSDKERASFASAGAILRRHANPTSPAGQHFIATLDSLEEMKQRVLASWDLQVRTSKDADPPPPLGVFLDWMYGEFLHSDAEKAARIDRLDGPFRLYEWQFHWVAERLASLFTRFALVVAAALGAHPA